MRVLAIDTALEVCAAAVLDTTASGQAGNGPAANGLAPNELAASETRAMARGHAEALMPLIAPIVRVASPDVPVPFSPVLENAYRPDAARIADAVRDLMSY